MLRRARGMACEPCRKNKAACEGQFPCDRCFIYLLPCRPQASSNSGRSSRASNSDALVRGEDDSGSPSSSTYLDLTFDRMDARALGALMSAVFLDMHQNGLISPAKAKEGLRAWGSISKLAGADVTHGATRVIAGALGLPEEGKKEDAVKEKRKGKEGLGKQGLAHSKNLAKALQESEPFQKEDDGVRALYLSTYAPREGVMVGASNAAFDKLFCGAQELMAYQVHRQTLSALLFAALLAPDDRACFFRLFFQHTFGSSSEEGPGGGKSTSLFKAMNREGEVGLYLVTVASVQVPNLASGGKEGARGGGGGGGGGGAGGRKIGRKGDDRDMGGSSATSSSGSSGDLRGLVLQLDPCPPSRYLAGGFGPRKPPPSSPSSSSFLVLSSSPHALDGTGGGGGIGKAASLPPLRHLPGLAVALPVHLPERESEEGRRLSDFAATPDAAALFQQSNEQVLMLHQQQTAALRREEIAAAAPAATEECGGEEALGRGGRTRGLNKGRSQGKVENEEEEEERKGNRRRGMLTTSTPTDSRGSTGRKRREEKGKLEGDDLAEREDGQIEKGFRRGDENAAKGRSVKKKEDIDRDEKEKEEDEDDEEEEEQKEEEEGGEEEEEEEEEEEGAAEWNKLAPLLARDHEIGVLEEDVRLLNILLAEGDGGVGGGGGGESKAGGGAGGEGVEGERGAVTRKKD